MEIPPRVVIPLSIEQGSIYHFELEAINHDGTEYKGDRFCIVLNANPKTEEVLVLTTITSQIKKKEDYIKKAGEVPETLVKISKTDFPRLSVDSIVNCNSVHVIAKGDLIKKIEKGGIIFFEKLPKSIVEALVGGVLKSNQVSNENKKLLI